MTASECHLFYEAFDAYAALREPEFTVALTGGHWFDVLNDPSTARDARLHGASMFTMNFTESEWHRYTQSLGEMRKLVTAVWSAYKHTSVPRRVLKTQGFPDLSISWYGVAHPK